MGPYTPSSDETTKLRTALSSPIRSKLSSTPVMVRRCSSLKSVGVNTRAADTTASSVSDDVAVIVTSDRGTVVSV